MLSNHYAGSTVCAPSRASLLTGKHPGHVSVRGNYEGMLLGDEETTLADVFKESGYVTGCIGKWGVGHPPPANDPERNGFDYFYGYINMWHAHNFYPEFLYCNGERVSLEGNKNIRVDGRNPWAESPEGTGVAETKTQYVHDLFDAKGLQFIENHKDTSFFLYMAYNVPHANNEAGHYLGDGMEVPDYGSYAETQWPGPEKGFAAMIENLDRSVGLINAKLEEMGLAENTLVIFVSDNGPHEEGCHSADFFDSNGILRGTKRDLYEGGIRTPFIARWPGTIEPGSSSDHVSAFWDMMPTFCEIAEAEVPANCDGLSFLPTLIGEPDDQEKHPYLYFEFYEQGGKQAILKDNWKGVKLEVRGGDPKPIELYNLADDPSETTDQSSEYPEIVAMFDSLMGISHKPLQGMSLFNEGKGGEVPF
jgi:arylsulfatase A-like enzyme